VKSNAAIERLAGLARVRDADLAGAARTPEARALLARIVAEPVAAPSRRAANARRRRFAVPATAAAAIAAAAVAVVLSSGGGHGTQNAAAATLRRAAAVARAQTPLIPGPGQYLYTKSIELTINTTVPAGGAATAYNVFATTMRQVWLGPDGGRLYETSGPTRFVTPEDRAHWIAAGRPDLTEGPSENTLPPAKPLDLPSDPDALYARLARDAAGHGSGLDSEMFTLVGDSLRETAATPAQRSALYQVAARIPGVELVGPVTDSAGRPGIAVARDDHGIRSMLVFDPQTSALLAEEQVALPGNPYGYPAGARLDYSTYVVQRIVDSDTATQ
jgi:hypothetical protein